MKAAIGNKHLVVVKIVKQMDELMVRNPYEEIEATIDEEEMLEIPRPSCLDMMGIEMGTENIEEEK
jgi:hypothetical protein